MNKIIQDFIVKIIAENYESYTINLLKLKLKAHSSAI